MTAPMQPPQDAAKQSLMKRLQGMVDSRGLQGMLSRGANVYNGAGPQAQMGPGRPQMGAPVGNANAATPAIPGGPSGPATPAVPGMQPPGANQGAAIQNLGQIAQQAQATLQAANLKKAAQSAQASSAKPKGPGALQGALQRRMQRNTNPAAAAAQNANTLRNASTRL